MNKLDLILRLNEAISRGKEEAEESHALHGNSYGSGYSQDYLDCLRQVLNTLNDQEEDVI